MHDNHSVAGLDHEVVSVHVTNIQFLFLAKEYVY